MNIDEIKFKFSGRSHSIQYINNGKIVCTSYMENVSMIQCYNSFPNILKSVNKIYVNKIPRGVHDSRIEVLECPYKNMSIEELCDVVSYVK